MIRTLLASLASLVAAADFTFAEPVQVQFPILYANSLAAVQDDARSARWAEVLVENTQTVLYSQVEQQNAITTYIALHSVPDQLTYEHASVTYEAMAAKGDRAGIRHLVALLTGRTRDLKPLAERVSCPQEEMRRICILSFGIFDVAGIARDDVQFEASQKVDVMRAFLLDLATETTPDMQIRFRSEIRIDASSGTLIDRLPSEFETERYRIYDDEVKTGVTSDVLPAAARGHEWLYPSVPGANYLALSTTANTLETWVTDDVVFPSLFTSTGGAFNWYLRSPDQHALAVDRSIAGLLTEFDAETMRAANATFKNYEDVFVEFDLAFERVAVADVSAYVAETRYGADYWDVVSVHFARVTAARIISKDADRRLELPLE